jgi:hypothetical protein
MEESRDWGKFMFVVCNGSLDSLYFPEKKARGRKTTNDF